MIRLNLYLTLLLIPIVLFSSPHVQADERGVSAQLLTDSAIQIASLDNREKAPCHCKAANGLGCSVFVLMGLHLSASDFNAASQIDFSPLQEMALRSNTQQVPLPPPKV